MLVDQAIARLDETDLKLAETSARAAVTAAASRRDVASDNLERAKVLLPEGDHLRRRPTTPGATNLMPPWRRLQSAEAQLRASGECGVLCNA